MEGAWFLAARASALSAAVPLFVSTGLEEEGGGLGVPGGVPLADEAVEPVPLPPPTDNETALAGFEPPMDRETAFASPEGGGRVILAEEGIKAGAGDSSSQL